MALMRLLRRVTLTKLRLLGSALLMVWLVRLGLWFLPFRSLRRAVSRVRPRSSARGAHVPPEWIAGAVDVAGRVVPLATCLTKGLAGYVLLRRWGYTGVLHIGVARDDAHNFQAHAWLECNRKVLIGDGAGHFVPLPPLEVDE